jgi:hypothetical protein
VRFTSAILIPLMFVVVALEPPLVLLAMSAIFAISAPIAWLWRRVRRTPLDVAGTVGRR